MAQKKKHRTSKKVRIKSTLPELVASLLLGIMLSFGLLLVVFDQSKYEHLNIQIIYISLVIILVRYLYLFAFTETGSRFHNVIRHMLVTFCVPVVVVVGLIVRGI